MKKIILALSLFGIIIIILLSGVQQPIETLAGCYIQETVVPYDKICLYEDNSYGQFLLGIDGANESAFNSGNWRSYSIDKEGSFGVSVMGYFDKFGDSSELDFFPYKTLISKAMFVTSGSEVAGDRFYIQE